MKSISQADLKGKRVLVRVDYNVPLNEQLEVTDATRIIRTKQTVNRIVEEGGIAILMSHLGRPKGAANDKMSLKHIVSKVSEVLGKSVTFLGDVLDADVEKKVAALKLFAVNLKLNNPGSIHREGIHIGILSEGFLNRLCIKSCGLVAKIDFVIIIYVAGFHFPCNHNWVSIAKSLFALGCFCAHGICPGGIVKVQKIPTGNFLVGVVGVTHADVVNQYGGIRSFEGFVRFYLHPFALALCFKAKCKHKRTAGLHFLKIPCSTAIGIAKAVAESYGNYILAIFK